MAGETTPTRSETVAANIAAVESKYGPEALDQIANVCLKDISTSLAMLVDAGSTSSNSSSSAAAE